MADSNTTNYSLVKPEVGASEDTWGTKLNQNLDTIDSKLDDIEGKSGAATLKHTDSTKLATTSTGVDVTGTVTADGLTVDNSGDAITLTNGDGLTQLGKLKGDTTDGFVIEGKANNNLTLRTKANTAGEGIKFQNTSGNNMMFIDGTTGDVSFYEDTGTTAKMVWDASAENLTLTGGWVSSSGWQSNGTVYEIASSIYNGVYGASANNIALATTGSERARITSSGTLLVGGSADYGTGRVIITQSADDKGIALADSALSYTSFFHGNSNGTKIGNNHTQPVTFFTNNSERARIDSSGNLLVGTTSLDGSTGCYIGNSGVIEAARSGVVQYLNRTGSDGQIAQFRKDGSTVGSIISYAGLYTIYNSDNGSGFLGVDGVRMYGWDTYRIYPRTDNIRDLGSLSYRFDDIYATNGTIQTSDRNEKQDIEVLNEAEQRVAQACKGLLRKFRWKDSVAEKGDEARIHFGIIAQDLQDAFTAEGLDAGRYAMFISSTWTDEETGEERTRLGVRYPELLAFIISAL